MPVTTGYKNELAGMDAPAMILSPVPVPPHSTVRLTADPLIFAAKIQTSSTVPAEDDAV
jgi:hypothetical protein